MSDTDLSGPPEYDGVFASVIIPAYNAERTIGEQLAALSRQTFEGSWEIIVADNGSDDATVDTVRRLQADIPILTVVDASARRGASTARNIGVQHARGDLLCFVDADDIVDEGWLAAITAAAQAHSIVAGFLEVDQLNDPSVRNWSPTPRAARADSPQRWAPGSNMAIWKSVFEELGGFDPDYDKAQDVELSERAVAAGHDIAFCPDAVVHYRYRTTIRGVANQGFRTGCFAARAHRDGTRGRRELKTTLWDWSWLLLRVPWVVKRDRRGLWVRRACEAAGRLVGSIRFKTWYL